MPGPLGLGLELPAFEADVAPPPPPMLADYLHAVQAARAAGFKSVWLSDRAGDGALGVDALTIAGGVAAMVRGPLVGVVADVGSGRHPAVLARDLICLDILSLGNAAVMLVDPARQRHAGGAVDPLARLAEAAAICRAIFAGRPAEPGRFFRIGAVNDRPRPVRPGGPPVLVVCDAPDGAEQPKEDGVDPPHATAARGGPGGPAPAGLIQCLRTCDAVVTTGSADAARTFRVVVEEICRSAAIEPVPAVLWRGSHQPGNEREGTAAMVGGAGCAGADSPGWMGARVPGAASRAAASTGAGGAVTEVGGAIVRLDAPRPPRADEVAMLARWVREEVG
jgi:hypothetical protein